LAAVSLAAALHHWRRPTDGWPLASVVSIYLFLRRRLQPSQDALLNGIEMQPQPRTRRDMPCCSLGRHTAARSTRAHGHYWIMKHDQFLVLNTNPMPPHVSVRASAYFQLRPFPFSSPSPCPLPCPLPCPFPSRLEPWPWSPSWSPRPALPTTPALVRPNRSRRQTLLRPATTTATATTARVGASP
jgi:hypothetical protein